MSPAWTCPSPIFQQLSLLKQAVLDDPAHKRLSVVSRARTLCCRALSISRTNTPEPGPVAAQMQHSESRLSTIAHPEIVIGNPAELERKKLAIKAAGLSSLQVIADFDMTLTKYKVGGVRGQSSHALLEQGNAEYDNKRRELFNHYYPLEICPEIPVDEKTKLMEEWWGKTHALLVEGGLTQRAIHKSVENAVISFREGVTDFFKFLEAENVPVLIFSAGLADIIEEVLRQKLDQIYKNIKVVSNRMDFDAEGNLLGFKGKLIHVLNKNEHSLEMAAPLHDDAGNEVVHSVNGYSLVRDRRNVILLGDHIGDLGMSDGVDYDNRITVGFLNENIDNWLNIYRASFDIVVLNDGSMSSVVDIVRELSQ